MSGGKWGNPKFDTNPEFSEPGTMKAYKFEVLVIDFDQLGGDEIAQTIQNANYPNDCISPSVESIGERDIGEWTDDHPLNKAGCSLEYQKLFNRYYKVEVDYSSATKVGMKPTITVGGPDGDEVLRIENPSQGEIYLATLWKESQRRGGQ